ncbi:unnamed protein product [Amoebophrya sp. A120]|nr:unnamed protein product [Amoebophrya sp. A120]|eukprot:GSA120T00005638001.1
MGMETESSGSASCLQNQVAPQRERDNLKGSPKPTEMDHEQHTPVVTVGIDEIRAAHARIRPHVHRTPVLQCSSLGEMVLPNAGIDSDESPPTPTELDLYFKCENLQKIGAFKIRGALNAISLSKKSVMVTHSSGNHAQAVALACRLLGKKAIVVMPKDSPQVKVSAVRDSYGAEVVFCEPNQPARESTCAGILAKDPDNSELIHPYDDARVVCGQGTLAVELIEQMTEPGVESTSAPSKNAPHLDAVVIAVGGGGLLAGCATAIRALSPTTKIIAAEPANANDCYRSFLAKARVDNDGPPKTIADSVKTNLGELNLPIILSIVDSVIQVSEEQIKRAMRLILERAKLVIEPGAAVAVAAALSPEFRHEFPECKRVGVVLCGGNLDIGNLPNLIL